MTDRVTSMFVPQTLLDSVAPAAAQDAANQAQRTFWWNLLSGDIGDAYNQAQNQGYNTLSRAQQLAQQQAALAEALRKAEAQRNLGIAVKDYTLNIPGEGTSDYSDPRAQFGPRGMGPGYIPPRQEIDVEGLLSDSRYLAANPNDTTALKTAFDLRQARQQRELYTTLANKYRREDGTVDAVKLGQDPAYVALLGGDISKLKTVDDLRATGTYQALAKAYTIADGTVDTVALSQDPRYIALLGNDAGKLKSATDIRTEANTRATYTNLAEDYTRKEDGTVDLVGMSQDPRYVALLGNDPNKLESVMKLRLGDSERKTFAALAQKHTRPDGTLDAFALSQDPAYVALPGNEVGKLKTIQEMYVANTERRKLETLAARYTRPDGSLDALALSQDPEYVSLPGNEVSKLKTIQEMYVENADRRKLEALAAKYKRGNVVDVVALSQDPEYIALLGNDPGKLKSIDEMRITNSDRAMASYLSSKHLKADGSVDFEKLASDPQYIAMFGGDPNKAKAAAELGFEESNRNKFRSILNSNPILTGAPGTPSTATQANSAKRSYLARIDALNNAGLFEEAARVTNQLQTLFPEEKFGQSAQFGTINGKRGAFVLGDRGTLKRVDGVQQAPSADALLSASKGEIRESEGGLVRINPFNGQATPVIGKDGKQVQGTSVGKVIETDGGVYRISGNTAIAITGPDGKQLAGKTGAGTEDERKAAGFYQRMVEAEQGMSKPILGKDRKPITDKNGNVITLEKLSGMPEVGSEMVRSIVPDFLGAQALGNMMDSKTRQQYRQFQENWVRANLRAESGAAIGVDEMNKEIKTYFPQIGDSQAVIDQKRDARRVTADSMRKRAGRSLQSNAPSDAAPSNLFPVPPPNTGSVNSLYQTYGLTPPGR